MERRTFLKSLALCGLSLSVGANLVACTTTKQSRFVSAASNHQGEHFVVAFDDAGNLLNQVKIANRGHDLLILNNERVVAFSRRPFTKLFIVDLKENTLENTLNAENGFHFYGHGVFDETRNLLITTENHIESAKGYLVFRDATSFEVVKRVESGGIGPHQLALMPDGEHIVVANGGIKTHPEKGREKLNLDTMAPNLSYVHLNSGKVVETVTPPHFQLSLRHLAVAKSGEVIVGAQYQGNYRDTWPLVFSHKRGDVLKPLGAEPDFWLAFNQYIASISINDKENRIAVTSPRGGIVAFWQLDNHHLISHQRFADCAGVANTHESFIVTNGKGQVVSSNEKLPLFQLQALRFDNHLIYS
ncbi:DUF1513 domain-containing protein [Pseudoalteromonas sp. SSM20]|uniref:DUF1513 domain-containing protein n=1 Tax=Pseudoalteromonas sp. SSM20 TaxID=3139394 RepID=UPI003BAB0F02